MTKPLMLGLAIAMGLGLTACSSSDKESGVPFPSDAEKDRAAVAMGFSNASAVPETMWTSTSEVVTSLCDAADDKLTTLLTSGITSGRYNTQILKGFRVGVENACPSKLSAFDAGVANAK